MKEIERISINTVYGSKSISVLAGDIAELDRELDVMTVSAFKGSYYPLFGTMIYALHNRGISVTDLSKDPQIDLRSVCSTWLSRHIDASGLPIQRIGCVEMRPLHLVTKPDEHPSDVLVALRSYFRMLDIASLAGVRIQTIGIPILGTGHQGISDSFIAKPIINECLQFLQSNESVREIIVIEYNFKKAEDFARTLRESYSIKQNKMDSEKQQEASVGRPLAFISYSSCDKNVADNLCAKLEATGIRVWYAPRDVDRPVYATAIVEAIARCSHFILILSKDSLASEHVLNEVDLGFQELKRGIRFYPLKLDDKELGPSFRYYLSRQHWMDATVPPLEQRLEEFVKKIRDEL
jgi:hypothetical protein